MAVVSLCGQAMPGCDDACSMWPEPTRRCVAAASTCQAAEACGEERPDAGAHIPADGGPACDGTKYCADQYTVARCESQVTRQTPCNGKKCADGRCGACASASDCTGITYRCKCTDGTEKTGSVDGACGDTQGSQSWCSHPSIDDSVCSGHGALDTSFGYLGTGCVSSVDP